MDNSTETLNVQPGDIVLLVGKDRKEFIISVEPGREHQTHHGVLPHDVIIGKRWGETVTTHLGYAYLILPPSLEQLVRSIRRATQIVYPKEIGYLLMKMNIGPGTRVIEAGTGSGGLTLALARMVMPHGHVYSYEVRPETQALAQKNLAALGLLPYVTLKLRDVAEGFDERGVDAVFLDVREPWDYLHHVHAALKGGGFFGSLLPTTNQVAALLRHLQQPTFGYIEVEELILRPYKAVPGRLRPFDRIIAHTGYLVFARALPGEFNPALDTRPESFGDPDLTDDAELIDDSE
ncbi:MAG TPA: tRNA (adenine-N1)-methyltransferase [Anaerolineae bacterium]|mgnify:CR=1 FL=1|nr:tRNA (adenine-N1)-methyltransferase [Anaerolineae bacterium]HQK13651.1 tRNA (adenine-N1)-methyltransferase [Anaerolineae bacterium]